MRFGYAPFLLFQQTDLVILISANNGNKRRNLMRYKDPLHQSLPSVTYIVDSLSESLVVFQNKEAETIDVEVFYLDTSDLWS